MPPTLNRRRFGAALAITTGLVSRPTLLASAAPVDAGESGWRAFPPNEAPFDAVARQGLAQDALTFFDRQVGLFPGRGTFQLPVAPWFGGWEPAVALRTWDVAVPAGIPLYLLANATLAEHYDPAATTISLDDVTVSAPETYVETGIAAVQEGRIRLQTVLGLVLAPADEGPHRVMVRTHIDGGPLPETVLLYQITVQAADAFGPWLLRDGQGRLWATQGRARRLVPDAETARLLGFGEETTRAADAALLAVLPEGTALPTLRDGEIVRAGNRSAVYRLDAGRRVWQEVDAHLAVPDAPPIPAPAPALPPAIQSLDPIALQTMPPVLLPDLLVKGAAADVYRVDGAHDNTLRKIPDWKWAIDHGLDPANVQYVPDRLIATLPQNSPEWVQPGGSWHDRTVYGDAVGRSLPYRVFLPPGYNAPNRAAQVYPTLYLLHGFGGRYDEWSGYGVEEVANQLIVDGQLPDLIMVAPQGGLGYWTNQDGAGGTLWADFVVHDLVRHVDATYRTIPRREARAIGGLSMGGHGALQLAFSHPDVFGVVGAHSPSLRGRDSAPAILGTDEASFAHHDPLSLLRSPELVHPPRLWLDVGEHDVWRGGAEALHHALDQKGWAHEWHMYPGEHDGWYWGDHLWEYLPFYGRSLVTSTGTST